TTPSIRRTGLPARSCSCPSNERPGKPVLRCADEERKRESVRWPGRFPQVGKQRRGDKVSRGAGIAAVAIFAKPRIERDEIGSTRQRTRPACGEYGRGPALSFFGNGRAA